MSNLLEVLYTSDLNNTLWTICAWDAHTGTNLMTYRGGGSLETKTLTFIGKDYIAGVEKAKPILNVWPINSHQTIQGMRFILPGKAGSLDISKDGAFCIAGIDEKIYLWQLSSGRLLTIINRHYQKVVHLKFTPDGRFFVSAAEDGMVMVWSLATVSARPEIELVTQKTAGQHDPFYVFSDHSLPVTDLYISKTGMHGRLCTVSSDRTCKIYDLSTGVMLLNLIFDTPLMSITMDVLELNVFVGTAEGNIHQFNLTNPPRNRDFMINTEENCSTFSSHSKGVICLSTSLDGETLMSGGNDEQVVLWHIKSKQPIRTIKHKGPIANAFFANNNQGIYKQDFKPEITIHSLDRTLDKDASEVSEIDIMINKSCNFWPDSDTVSDKGALPLSKTEIEFEMKKNHYEEELENLKKINANLYAFSVGKTLESFSKSPNQSKKKKKIKSSI